MTNEQRIIEAAKAHRAGASAHKFNTEFGWKKAGFCPRKGVLAKFSAKLSFWTGKGYIWKDEPIFRDDQVTPIAQEKPKASAPKKVAPVKKAREERDWCYIVPQQGEMEKRYYALCKDASRTKEFRQLAYKFASGLRAKRLATGVAY